jgi:hypothetical protein
VGVSSRTHGSWYLGAIANKTSIKPKKAAARKPTLLSGGNPQIAKAHGEAPVKAYIAAMPGWKRNVGRRLDKLIACTVPGVKKAVKWNSPFYGIEDQGWFLNFLYLGKEGHGDDEEGDGSPRSCGGIGFADDLCAVN